MSEVPTLYEWAGGRAALEAMIDCFYDRVERDGLLSPFFPGGVSAAHREHVTTWWCEVFGGAAGYTERLGGYPAMLAHHRDLHITAEQRFRFASLMSLGLGVWPGTVTEHGTEPAVIEWALFASAQRYATCSGRRRPRHEEKDKSMRKLSGQLDENWGQARRQHGDFGQPPGEPTQQPAVDR